MAQYIGCRSIPFQHLCLLLRGEYALPFIRAATLSEGRSEDTLPEVNKSSDSPYGSVAHTSTASGEAHTLRSTTDRGTCTTFHATRYIRPGETSRLHVLTTAQHTTYASDCHLTQPKRVRLTSPTIPTRITSSFLHAMRLYIIRCKHLKFIHQFQTVLRTL